MVRHVVHDEFERVFQCLEGLAVIIIAFDEFVGQRFDALSRAYIDSEFFLPVVFSVARLPYLYLFEWVLFASVDGDEIVEPAPGRCPFVVDHDVPIFECHVLRPPSSDAELSASAVVTFFAEGVEPFSAMCRAELGVLGRLLAVVTEVHRLTFLRRKVSPLRSTMLPVGNADAVLISSLMCSPMVSSEVIPHASLMLFLMRRTYSSGVYGDSTTFMVVVDLWVKAPTMLRLHPHGPSIDWWSQSIPNRIGSPMRV